MKLKTAERILYGFFILAALCMASAYFFTNRRIPAAAAVACALAGILFQRFAMRCPHCGARLGGDWGKPTCSRCGGKLREDDDDKSA